VFGSPVAHEDDALRAVRAASEVPPALARLDEAVLGEHGLRLFVRVAVATGEVVSGEAPHGQGLVTGDVVGVAARLQHAAPPGGVVLDENTRRLVIHAADVERLQSGELALGGDRLEGWLLHELASEAPAIARRFDVPLVGRTQELNSLKDVFMRVVDEKHAALITVIGEPGIGKTRLAREFETDLAGRARVLWGRCLAYGEGITFWALREMVREVGRVEERDALIKMLSGDPDGGAVADRIAATFGHVEAPYPLEEIFWATRKLFEALAEHQPLLLCFDDVHWEEPTLLELIEHVAERSESPILLLCLAREELLEERAQAICASRLASEGESPESPVLASLRSTSASSSSKETSIGLGRTECV
jgi:hypothetical protein